MSSRSMRSRLTGQRGLSRGFTLLEVLLAFVIFAISFAVVLEILGGSMRSTVRARDYSEAALLAQSLMDMVGNEFPLEESSFGGDAAGGYEWVIEIVPYAPQSGDEYLLDLAYQHGTMLYWVDLELRWQEGSRERQVHFSTVRSILEGRQG